MTWDWLKRYMPRRLYARAALILILPILTLQIVVTVVFVQRYFEDVTRQMTRSALIEMDFMVGRADGAENTEAAAALVREVGDALGFTTELPAPPAATDAWRPWDLPGRVIVETLHARLPAVTAVDVAGSLREVHATLQTRHGPLRLSFPRSRVTASAPHQLLVLMIVTGALMTVIAYLFLRNQLRPIKQLAEAADAFGKGRHVAYRPAGASEVRLAGTTFLDMRGRIERQIEQRTLMLSGVSHDLRTPLTRLKLSLEMLDAEPDETEAMLRDVRDMERLVDEFLSFARGDALDDPVATDPGALLADVVTAAQRAGRRVTLTHADAAALMPMRPMAVARALDNLIGNAARHGSGAWVGLDALARGVRFSVEDDGPGIPQGQRQEALKAFAQLDPARNQDKATGVGLGLAIAADIARKHGGTLTLGRSEAFGGLRADLVIAR